MSNEAPNPWERQPGETSTAFAAFRRYRDTPAKDRSIAKCVQEYNKGKGRANVGQWERWSTKHNWVARVTAWEDEQDRVARTARLEEIVEMNRRHTQIAMAMIGKAAERLKGLQPTELTPAELRQYFNDAVRLERLARGEAESRHEHDIDVSKLSDEQLQAIIKAKG